MLQMPLVILYLYVHSTHAADFISLYFQCIMSTITACQGSHVSFSDGLVHAKEKLNKRPG